MGARAFALRNRGDCYVSRYSSTYSSKKRLFGRFRGSSGTSRSIDAYVIGKGKTDKEWLSFFQEKSTEQCHFGNFFADTKEYCYWI